MQMEKFFIQNLYCKVAKIISPVKICQQPAILPSTDNHLLLLTGVSEEPPSRQKDPALAASFFYVAYYYKSFDRAECAALFIVESLLPNLPMRSCPMSLISLYS